MNSTRKVVIGGHTFKVPERIQRLDHRYTHGWQLRYDGTRLFSDGKAGPAAALKQAVEELQRRYAVHAPPSDNGSHTRDTPLPNKQNDLPAGISGPVMIHKDRRAPYAEFKVSLPRKGKPNAATSVYIATENTWDAEHYDAALAKAVRLRDEAVRRVRA